MHEFFHTFQGVALLNAIEPLHEEGDVLGDDEVQRRFGKTDDYKVLHGKSVALLWDAWAERDDAKSTKKTNEALAAYDVRRAKLKSLDERQWLFEPFWINNEGVAEFARLQAYMGATSTNARLIEIDPNFTGWTGIKTMSREDIVLMMHSQQKKWSQDEGLVMMLLIDRFVPDWRAKILGPEIIELHTLLRER